MNLTMPTSITGSDPGLSCLHGAEKEKKFLKLFKLMDLWL